ncbi:MAG: ADP-glyceromanno-heptose 6-epimerase [Alphaproteobacteria bacterium]
MRKLVVVTGGAGFIGSNVVGALARRGDVDVLVCDRMGRDERWRNLAGHEIAGVVAPERLIDVLAAEVTGLDTVIHMGALSSTTETDVGRFVEDNIRPSLALWQFCAAHGKRLIYASSAAVYGDGQAGFDDDPTPAGLARLRPLNAYGWSKLVVDRRCTRLASLGQMAPVQWAGLRLFNVYGPNEGHKGDMRSVVTKNAAAAARGEPVMLFASGRPGIPDGGQRRDFVYVKDCVSVILWLLDHGQVSGLFNVGTGRAQSFAELIGALFRAYGRQPDIVYRPMPPALEGRYQYFTEARLDRLRRAGYTEPFHDVERGVADYVTNHLVGGDGYA